MENNTIKMLMELDLMLLKMETEQGYIDYPELKVSKEAASDER